MAKPQDRGTWFEKKIVKFLKQLGFHDVNRRVQLETPEEVDVLAGWQNTLFAIECRWKGKTREYNLKNDLRAIRGQMDSIKAGAKRHSTYAKYDEYRFVLATRNVIYREADKTYAGQGNKTRIYLWNENVTDYYESLAKAIGSHATYDLLGEMSFFPASEQPLRLPAFQTSLMGTQVYALFCEP